MKYLTPLITNEKSALKPCNNILEKYNVQYHIPKENYLIINDKYRKIMNIKQRNKNSAASNDNIHKTIINLAKNTPIPIPKLKKLNN